MKYKLLKRIFIPWVIVNIGYTLVRNYNIIFKSSFLNIMMLFIKNIIYPWYHLWFILGYISYIIIIYFLVKFHIIEKYNKILYIIILSSSILIYIWYFYFPRKWLLGNIFLSNFRLYNFIFFYTGYLLKNMSKIISKTQLFRNIIIMIFSATLCFYLKVKVVNIILFYIINIFLIINSIQFCKTYKQIKNNIITNIGKYSLYIYLLHIFPIILLNRFINKKNYIIYYVIGIILELILIDLIIIFQTYIKYKGSAKNV